jgi:hypothetical protein
VRGRENLLVRDLDRFDIQHLSQPNCHPDADWRDLHNAGQGVLFHLEDLGLTEEIPFGPRERIVIKLTLLTSEDPEAETFEHLSTQSSLDGPRTFHVALLRENQLLTGDSTQIEFRYDNQ